ncbi:MAG: hypothetical protein Q9169_004528 [Polycauliona sp. 2 TL-2023]
MSTSQPAKTPPQPLGTSQSIEGKLSSSEADPETTTSGALDDFRSASTAKQLEMLEFVAYHIRKTIPWDQFTLTYGIDGPDFEEHVLRPLLAPLYRYVSGDVDTLFTAAADYRTAMEASRKLMPEQERENLLQETRDLRDYENMCAEELWQKRKMGLKTQIRVMKGELDGLPVSRKNSQEYRDLDLAIKHRQEILVRMRAARVEAKRVAKDMWKAEEAEIEGSSVGDENAVL